MKDIAKVSNGRDHLYFSKSAKYPGHFRFIALEDVAPFSFFPGSATAAGPIYLELSKDDAIKFLTAALDAVKGAECSKKPESVVAVY